MKTGDGNTQYLINSLKNCDYNEYLYAACDCKEQFLKDHNNPNVQNKFFPFIECTLDLPN